MMAEAEMESLMQSERRTEAVRKWRRLLPEFIIDKGQPKGRWMTKVALTVTYTSSNRSHLFFVSTTLLRNILS